MLSGGEMGRKPYSTKSRFWKLFEIDEGLYFFQSYNVSRTPRVCPAGLVPALADSESVGYTHYKGSKEGHVTTYLVKSSRTRLEELAEKEGRALDIQPIVEVYGSSTDFDFNIESQHVELADLTLPFIHMTRQDIVDFCEDKTVKKRLKIDQNFTLVDKIKIEPRISFNKPSEHNVVKDGKGFFYPICLLNIGIDLSLGCISNITPDFWYDTAGKCGYCYAHKNGPSYLDTVFDIDEKWMINRLDEKIKERKLEDKEVIYFRIAQNIEANTAPVVGHLPGFQDNLKITLRSLRHFADKSKIQTSFPSKMIEYDSELSELLKAANTTLLASVGYECIESGMRKHGFGLEKRLKEALKYAKDGVNVALFVATDITRGLESLQDDSKRAVDFFRKNEEYLKLQFLDIRITQRKHAEIIAGKKWDDLKMKKELILFNDQFAWGLTGQNYLHARWTHQDFLEIIGNNDGKIRFCSTHAKEEEQRCGKCFMDEE